MPLSKDESVNETAGNLLKAFKGAFGTPPGFRPAHARGIILTGTFTPTSDAGSLSKASHFTKSSTPLIARFSNSTGLPQIPDNDGHASPRGLALRFNLGLDSKGHRSHTDMVAHSSPYFPARTGAEFLELLQAMGASAAPDASSPSPIEKFLGSHPAAADFVKPRPMQASFATEKYYGLNAFKLIDSSDKTTFVRYQFIPEAGVSYLSDEEVKNKDTAYLHNEIQTRVIDGGVSFKLVAQVAEDGDTTNDVTVHWPETRKVVELGTIKLNGVAEDNDELQRTTIFDPVPRVEGVGPSDDPLLDMRASVYLQSGRERRAAHF